VRLGVEQVAAQRAIVADYRDALVPQREAVVQRQLERFNYMLIGAFELLLAKQEEYDAYQAYLQAIGDYWQARVALARAVGAELPSSAASGTRALGVDAVLQPAAESAGHGAHAGHGKPVDHSAHGTASGGKDGHTPASHGTHDEAATPQDHRGHEGHGQTRRPQETSDPHDHGDHVDQRRPDHGTHDHSGTDHSNDSHGRTDNSANTTSSSPDTPSAAATHGELP
jgi:cobalt-zinc-cadmium efflux system outer membrane protein